VAVDDLTPSKSTICLRSCRQKWESKWKMAFNADKCFVIRAGTKRKTIKQDYTIHNHILEVVEESKYSNVGLTIVVKVCCFTF
jgi:hypothetical protein